LSQIIVVVIIIIIIIIIIIVMCIRVQKTIHESKILSPVYSDTTQLNSTQLDVELS